MGDSREMREAIRRMHGCEARHVESVPIKEVHRGRTVWEGAVEVYDLTDCPIANRCYSWSFEDDGATRYMAVLHKPPVDGPRKAVQVAIAGEFRDQIG